MNGKLRHVLDEISKAYQKEILKGGRNYLEVNIGRRAGELGYFELCDEYTNSYAIIPLKAPRQGMKVLIDGRSFVNYAEYLSGIVVPAYIADKAGGPYVPFNPNDSMICNFDSVH